MNNCIPQQLLDTHAAAKKKMVRGIVFTAIAFFLSYLSLVLIYSTGATAVIFLLLISLVFWGLGIPFLISGIIRTSKANRQIALARAAAVSQVQAPATAPVAAAVAEEVPVAASVAEETPAAEEAPSVEEVPVVEETPVVEEIPAAAEPAAQTGFVDIDWKKYAPPGSRRFL